jgi:hypothetical protein
MSSPEVGRAAGRWLRALITGVILPALHGISVAQGTPKTEASTVIVSPTQNSASHIEAVAQVAVSDRRGQGLAQAIAASAHVSLVDTGVKTGRQSLLDCQKEALNGVGTGTLGMPQGRPASRTDHCFR